MADEDAIPSGRLWEVRQWDLLCPVPGCFWRMRLYEVPPRGNHPPDYVEHYLSAHRGVV